MKDLDRAVFSRSKSSFVIVIPFYSFFLTASYDSCCRIFTYDNPQEPILTFRVPAMSPSSPQSLVDARWIGEDQVAMASIDGSVRVWSMPEISNFVADAGTSSSTQQPKQTWWGSHHPLLSSKAVQSVNSSASPASSFGMSPSALTSIDVSADGKALLTASRDGSVAYWQLEEVAAQGPAGVAGEDDLGEDDDDDAKRKRRKGSNGKKRSAAAGSGGKRPSALLWHSPPTASNTSGASTGPFYVPASNARVSQAVFDPHDSTRAVSVGYDGRLIEWDLFSATKGGNPKLSVRQTSDSRAILCVALPKVQNSGAKVVTGQMDRSICLWDLSSSSSTSSATIVLPNAHAGPIYSISSHPNEPHLFATAGGDGAVKMWDARSHKRALFALRAPTSSKSGNAGDKLLACEWDRFTAEGEASGQGKGHIVLAGGEDCTVNVFRQDS